MASRRVDPELGTSWDDQPVVAVVNRSNHSTTLVLVFVTTPGDDSTPVRRSRLTFHSVWYYRWIEWDLGYEPDNTEDYEFALIEVLDSELVGDIRARGKYLNDGPTSDLKSVLGPDRPRHFRIAFDDHGMYDVLCDSVDVEHDDRSAWAPS